MLLLLRSQLLRWRFLCRCRSNLLYRNRRDVFVVAISLLRNTRILTTGRFLRGGRSRRAVKPRTRFQVLQRRLLDIRCSCRRRGRRFHCTRWKRLVLVSRFRRWQLLMILFFFIVHRRVHRRRDIVGFLFFFSSVRSLLLYRSVRLFALRLFQHRAR